jgi:plastocyanin
MRSVFSRAFVLTLLAVVIFLTACSSDDDSGDLPLASSPRPTNAATASGGGSGSTIDVAAVSGNAFNPRRPTVRAGQSFTIRFQNTDSTTHTLNIQNGPSTGNVAPGASATITFNAPTGGGGIAFFCQIHGQNTMNGTIVYE